MSNGFISIIKKKFVINLPFILLILILGTYLTVKAIPENSWDSWGFGSAQALLSAKQWVEGGVFKNYFLYLPQGYSKTVQYFDDPELRQHAHGIIAGGLIGQRLYYTHYPPGFLVPTFLMMKAGVENRFWFRFLQILFSLGGLAFLYWFIKMVYNKTGAFWGTLFFGISILFWGYADTLTNQPIDLLLGLAIVVLSVWTAKSNYLSAKTKKYFDYLIWILYFILAFSSYDSTFFIFAWLVGTDLIIKKEFRWKKWLAWALAPILAFGLQALQNVWYLGWHSAVLDFYGTFNMRIVGTEQNFLISHIRRLIGPFDNFFGVQHGLGILTVSALFLYICLIKTSETETAYKYLILAGIATLVNLVFFPTNFFYQSRTIAVFGGLLIAMAALESVKMLKRENLPKLKLLYIAALILIFVLFVIQAKRSSYVYRKADNSFSIPAMQYDKKIKNLLPGDKVIFQMLSLDQKPSENGGIPRISLGEKTFFPLFGNHDNIPGDDPYPEVNTEDEYYVGSPILGFVRISDLVRDLEYLKKRSEFPFSAIILSDHKEILDKIQGQLMIKKISKNNLKIVELESDKFALIVLSQYLHRRKFELLPQARVYKFYLMFASRHF